MTKFFQYGKKRAINRCRDCPDWEEYKIPCGNRMGKCKNELSYFFNNSRSQYAYKCLDFELKTNNTEL